ncbi:MAG: GAF domain-containing protein, partial [Chloroflexi bacterium]|nr:GAF domain-containing protein [Chloroflexota bacterium]
MVEEERWGAITQLSTHYGRLLLLILALGVMLPLLFAIIGMRRIMHPVTALTAAARHMAAGELQQEIPLPKERQLAELAEAFNMMSRELRTLYDDLERKVDDRTRELFTLNTLANALSRSLDLEEVLQAALKHAMEALNFPMGAAYRLEKDEQHFGLITHIGLSEGAAQRLRRPPVQLFRWGEALGDVPQHYSLPTLPPQEVIDLLRQEGWHDVIVLPLLAKGAMVGLIHLASPEPYALPEDERSLLAAMGQQIGMAVENARLYEEAEETAIAAERSRLARELHDSVTQTLFSANLIAGVLPSL